jgi:hypothetical protein
MTEKGGIYAAFFCSRNLAEPVDVLPGRRVDVTETTYFKL